MTGIRQARLDDAAAIGFIEVETWQATYAGLLDDHTLIAMSTARKARQWAAEMRHGATGLWVWEDDQLGLLGFGHCGAQRVPSLTYDGEISMLYVLPDAQGQGIGRNLLQGMFTDLKDRGMGSVLVWVLEANPSRFFYARLGGKLVLRRTIPFGATQVDALGYGWEIL
ncbi:MAG: GNAT family N-acetyltransferase [Rhodospirillaceae bacterium]|nr:GNAT family N-acetyltransferase [Rhodospirillales bacterium]